MLTLAMLSWGQQTTLLNTLDSYQMFGLLPLADEKLIFFQEICESDMEIAEHYGFRSIGASTNIGIANAYAELVMSANEPLFLFLENDWLLLECPDARIAAGIDFLNSDTADVVRYRSRAHPGDPLWTRQFERNEYARPTHLLDSIHWRPDPSVFPEIEAVPHQEEVWYRATARNANWTNNPTMFKRQFLKCDIVPRLMEGDIEQDLQPWWEQQDFRVMQGEGLFTHFRIG